MSGVWLVLRREVQDQVTSWRFFILLVLVFLSGFLAIYVSAQNIRGAVPANAQFVFIRLFTTSGEVVPPFVTFLGFFLPLVGIALAFDAINSERSNGVLVRVLSQPIYRDAVINGKFLAGVLTIALLVVSMVLLVSGLGLRLIGVPPTLEEIARLLAFVLLSVVYGAFWLGLSLLFSLLFSRTATSALASLALWLFLVFFMFLVAQGLAGVISPLGENPTVEQVLAQEEAQSFILRLSPATLYDEAMVVLLDPDTRTTLPVAGLVQRQGMVPNPLSLGQSLLLVWPQLTGLLVLTLVCFAISYVRFLREELRST